ncbi:CD5 antigen-like [Xenopus laevis]|uniref:SRCR domain-containing protein n=2 Tax=Xenopus laevis TaxID=8355 RepID=A0A974HCJ7_XENLA|nr:CD5 antigen-like [Xenopus laevis]OCT72903.1 hypothetical protein XELAEV_18035884mg [Xenopus laevis]
MTLAVNLLTVFTSVFTSVLYKRSSHLYQQFHHDYLLFANMRTIDCVVLGFLFGLAISDSLNIRLVDGNSSCKGRLEVNRNGIWGTVCNDQWDKKDAKVVCKQLQCGPPKFSYECQPFGEGSGPIWLDEVKCTGNEFSLSECKFNEPGVHDCEHREDVSVLCREHFKIQLVNGSSRCAGRLEVFYDGEWGSVCDDDWDRSDSQVVCHQLGCGGPQLNRGPRFGQASGRIWLDDVQCNGNENSLEECKHRTWSYNDCTHEEDVSVHCTGIAGPRLKKLQNGFGSPFRGLSPFHSSRKNKIKKRTINGKEDRKV